MIFFLSLFLPFLLFNDVSGKRCYECGYMQIDGGKPQAIANMTSCNEFVDMESLAVDCSLPDDCCAVIRETLVIENTETKKNETLFLVAHACLNGTLGSYELSCADANGDITKDCKVFDTDTLPVNHEETLIRAEVCLCKDDLCNNKIPDPPAPTSTTTEKGPGKKCYDCGYMVVNGKNPEPIPHEKFCNDFTNSQDLALNCNKVDDCCSVVREYVVEMNLETHVNETIMYVAHGCYEEKAGKYGLTCEGAAGSLGECKEIDEASLPADHMENLIKAEVCICNNDLCNDKVPATSNSPADTTTSYDGHHVQCYDCGYIQENGQEAITMPDVEFCNGFINPESFATDCTGANDCCAVVKSFKNIWDEANNVNKTTVAVRHGCFNTLGLEEHYHLSCGNATNAITDDCMVYEDDKLPVDHEVTMYREEVCMCNGVLCNNDVPATTLTPTTTPGTSSALFSSVSLIIVALFLQQ